MSKSFRVGQRWLSDAEPDLGLGGVTAIEGRLVRVLFGASGLERTYTVQNAPLSRVRLEAGDQLQDRNSQTLQVVDVIDREGLIVYACETADGERVELPEQELNDRLKLGRPSSRLLARRIDPDTWFTLRYQTWERQALLWRSPVHGLCGPRVDLIPHQLYIAAEVSGRSVPRVLLADEVGLGKTIEAGLILHRLLLTERARRVLIVVPAALTYQWLVEMLRRFNLHFSVFDAERFADDDSDNPFLHEQRVLCSLDFLCSDPEVARAALDGEWDLLIADEAHHLRWSEDQPSLEYELVEALAAQTRGVLLLTATPEQLGRVGHFARLRLLDPQRFHDFASFRAEEQDYTPVAAAVGDLLAGRTLDAATRKRVAGWLDEDVPDDPRQLIERLVDRHGTGRILFRNTRQAIKGFPGRAVERYALEPAAPSYHRYAAQLRPEEGQNRGWLRKDPRVAWLAEFVRAQAPEKILVICARAETVVALRDHLRDREALHLAMFHEGMEIVERDRAAAYFAASEEGAQALLCSEIGSEGRNFQFSRHLVLFDLPLEPDLLEQRIGRLDRIGQRHTIRIHIPCIAGGAADRLFRWYHDGLDAFRATCPAASAVFEALGERLRNAIDGDDDMDALVADAAAMTASLNLELEQGRDRLLELHSNDPEIARELAARIEADADREALRDYMIRFWDAYGVEHQAGPGHSTVVHPGAHMLHDRFPGLAPYGMTASFDRADALAHEDRAFLTWEHPMVRGAMDMLTSGGLGVASVTVASHPQFKTGTAFLEMLYVAECVAPAVLEAERFLPPTCKRLLLDMQGRDVADSLAHPVLQGLCLTQNRKLADTVIKSQAARIKVLVGIGDEIAQAALGDVVAKARSGMRAALGEELERLVALARRNPNVREEEIEQLEARRDLLDIHLSDTTVRLDAVRLVVMR